jgi:hypothetical protein
LSLTDAEVAAARGQLVAAHVLAYEKPLYQVLALEPGARDAPAGQEGPR